MVAQIELNEDSIFEIVLIADIMCVVRKLLPNISKYETFNKECILKLVQDVRKNMNGFIKRYECFDEITYNSAAVCMEQRVDLLFGESYFEDLRDTEELRNKLNELKNGEIIKTGIAYTADSGLMEDFDMVDNVLSDYLGLMSGEDGVRYSYYNFRERFYIWEIEDKVFLNYAKLSKDDTVRRRKLMYILQGALSAVNGGALIMGYEVKEDKIKVLFHEENDYGRGDLSLYLFEWRVSSVIQSIILKMCIEKELSDVEGK